MRCSLLTEVGSVQALSNAKRPDEINLFHGLPPCSSDQAARYELNPTIERSTTVSISWKLFSQLIFITLQGTT